MSTSSNKPKWKKYDSRMVIFPALSEEDVRNICFGNTKHFSVDKSFELSRSGNYQIQQAKGYIEEHLKPSILDEEELEFVVELCSNHHDLVRVRFVSRHSSSKTYMATVQFDQDDENDPIKAWFCTCFAGARIIGCCAHITALIWHLGVCRGETDGTPHPLSAAKLILSVDDCIQYSTTDESDDDQSDTEQSSTDGAT